MKKLLKRVKDFFQVQQKAQKLRQQSGYVVISLAAIGLFGGTAAAVPVLNRIVGSLNASDAGPASLSGASCAAEHALWRLENDPTVWTSMSGSPPSVTYQTPACGVFSDADVTVAVLEDPPTGDDRFQLALTVDPPVVDSGVDSQFTYTMSVTNDDYVPHYITRVRYDPTLLWRPDVVDGTTTGISTSDPTRVENCFFIWCWVYYDWDLYPYVEVPAFGGQVELNFTAEENTSGSQYAGGSVWFDGIGQVEAPNTTRVRFETINPQLLVEETVTPTVVFAGNATTFDYHVKVTNNDTVPLTLEWIRSWHDQDFSYVYGSAEFEGVPIADPDIFSQGPFFDFLSLHVTLDSRARLRWNLTPTSINPGDSIDLTFQMQGSLQPGMYHSRASAYVSESPANWFEGAFELSSHHSGETAPVEVIQGFTVSADHEGTSVEVEGNVTESGIEVTNWKEF